MKQQKAEWIRFEEELATLIGAKRTPGSGNGNRKGDLWLPAHLVECKQSGLSPMKVNTMWFSKIIQEAARHDHRIPLLALQFATGERRFFFPELRLPLHLTSEQLPQIIWIQKDVYTSPEALPPGAIIQIGALRWLIMDQDTFVTVVTGSVL